MSKFPLPVLIIFGGTLMFGLSYFMTWPFLAIILSRDFDMNAAQIGSALSLAAFTGALAAMISGNLSDRFGRKVIIFIGNVSITVAFAIIATAETAFWIITAAVIIMATRHLVDPPMRALISDLCKDEKIKELAFHLNYFMVNLGATTGPFIALFLGISARQSTFWVTAIVMGIYTLLLAWILRNTENAHDGENNTHWKEIFTVLRADKVLLWLITGSIFIAFTYAQQDSSTVQYLTHFLDYQQAAYIFTFVVAGNSATVVMTQFPLLRIMKNWSYDARIKFGVIGFFMGFIIYSIIPVDFIWGWVLGTVVLSIGEAVLFPTLGLKTDQIAPKHLKGTYFGAGNLYALGYGIGPLIGGGIIAADIAYMLWPLATGICIISFIAYHKSGQLFAQKKQFEQS